MKTVPKPSGKSTASRAIYASVSLIVFIAITLTILATACSSTTIEEPQPSTSTNSDDLVITLSTPYTYTFPASRADGTDIHAGHELRYTAILYKCLTTSTEPVGISGNENRIQRIEKLAKDDNKIVFKSIPPDDYFIVVFADYISENADPSEEGHYPDKYYDTTLSPNYITLLQQDDESTYFNNDNLDFFIDNTGKFTKEKNKPEEFKITLHRHVSKVQVKAIGGNIEALKEIVINSCHTLGQLDMISGNATAEDQKNISRKSVTLTPVNGTLLYSYYTFCTRSTIALNGTSFTLIPNEGYEFANGNTITIATDKVLVIPEANMIYTIQGAFLNTSALPSKVADIKVTTDNNWIDSSQDLSN